MQRFDSLDSCDFTRVEKDSSTMFRATMPKLVNEPPLIEDKKDEQDEQDYRPKSTGKAIKQMSTFVPATDDNDNDEMVVVQRSSCHSMSRHRKRRNNWEQQKDLYSRVKRKVQARCMASRERLHALNHNGSRGMSPMANTLSGSL